MTREEAETVFDRFQAEGYMGGFDVSMDGPRGVAPGYWTVSFTPVGEAKITAAKRALGQPDAVLKDRQTVRLLVVAPGEPQEPSA